LVLKYKNIKKTYLFRLRGLFSSCIKKLCLFYTVGCFAWTLMLSSSSVVAFLSIPTLVMLFILIGLELAVSLIQAYVFTVLTCMFINDASNLH